MTVIIMMDENGSLIRQFFKEDGPRYTDWNDWEDGHYTFVYGNKHRCIFVRRPLGEEK